MISCGVDLGGTKIAIGLVDERAVVTDREIIRGHRGLAEDQVVATIAASAQRLFTRNAVSATALRGVGVGTAGHVNYAERRLVSNSNLPGFRDYPLGSRLEDALSLPVVLDNDANAQAYAEYRYGAARGYENVLFVTVSTGLGAGIILDGRVYRGATGTAGEIGHTIIEPASTIQCGCGNYGCLMALGSGLTLPAVVREAAAVTPSGIDFAEREDDEITGELIKEGLDRGDPLCSEVVRKYAWYLGVGLHNAVQTLCPAVIVVGGGLTGWGPVYLQQVRDTFVEFARKTIDDLPEIRLSELGADAAIIGAAALVAEAESRRAVNR